MSKFHTHMRRCTKTMWQPKEGSRVHVRAMHPDYVLNTVLFIRRWASHAQTAELLDLCHASRYLHGEMAIDAVESESSRIAAMSVDEYAESYCPCWEALLRRLDRITEDTPEGELTMHLISIGLEEGELRR